MAFKRLESCPVRERIVDDPQYMNLARSWEKWFGLLVPWLNAGIAHMDNVPVYADNAAALTGKLTSGDIYRTGDGTLKIVI